MNSQNFPLRRRQNRRSQGTMQRFSRLNLRNPTRGPVPAIPHLTTHRWNTAGFSIPDRTYNPWINKVVRISGMLSSVTPTIPITYSALALEDASDYGTAVVRYLGIRVLAARLYVESYPTTSTAPSIGAYLEESLSGTAFEARPVSGASYAAVGLVCSMETAMNTVTTVSATVILLVGTDIPVPVVNTVRFTLDVWCSFT
jgi:hypothetical protein